jgi:E3 ubiquitin-protein ligase HERC2
MLLQQRDEAEHHAVGAGFCHSFFIDETGSLFSCGMESCCHSGRLGRGDMFLGIDLPREIPMQPCYQILPPVAMPFEQGVRMRGVSTGQEHSVAVSEDGLVFLSGSRANPASTLLSNREARRVPTVVEQLRACRMRMVAAGASHSVALSEDGVLFSWGDASAVHGEWRYAEPDSPVLGDCEVYGRGLGREVAPGADRVPQPVTALAGVRIATEAAGDFFTLAVSEAGAVYSFGKGGHGRLGHGDRLNVRLPKQIQSLRGVCVLTVAAGGAHALALTRSGVVYSWGLGDSGQLGHGLPCKSKHAPAIVEALRGVRVDRIAAGDAHSCASSSAGGLYTWGYGEQYQLGHRSWRDESTPRLVEAAWGQSALGLWAGPDHMLVLDGEGNLLGFGRGLAAGIPLDQRIKHEDWDWEVDGYYDQALDESESHFQMVPAQLGGDLRVKLS